MSVGFFGAYELRELVKENPEALALTDKQRQFQGYAELSFWLGVVPSLGFYVSSVTLLYRDNNLTLYTIATLALLGTSILTGHFSSVSRHYMYEAINVYNGVSVMKTSGDSGSVLSSAGSPYSVSLNAGNTPLAMSFSF